MPGKTFAERLGWGPNDRVLIIHIDDAGMSHSSNMGAIEAITHGAGTSCSIMAPCAWTPEIVHHARQNPALDAGLHITLTAEWQEYRWGPVAGKQHVPGLVDPEGCLWPGVPEVVEHATADEVETEIRAQLDRLLTMGYRPTHLDSHMGTVFANPEYIQKYFMIGAEHGIPLFVPGGHNQYMIETEAIPPGINPDTIQAMSQALWEMGSPVLDDCHLKGCDWDIGRKVDHYIDVLQRMRPGLMQIILHATQPSDAFHAITDSGPARETDLRLVQDPRFNKALQDQHIILSTWQELRQRRKQAD